MIYRGMGARRQRGFTLVEMMTVVVVLGILLSIGIINLSSANQRAREAAVRSNMHSFQTLVELYSVDNNGFYPANVEALMADPQTSQQRLLSEMKNPFTARGGFNAAYDNDSATPKAPGLTTYAADPSLASYAIYGYDNLVQRLIYNGNELILSNN
jgi:prepilin-type N-terminal cleavage/methylation domain-containing protein